MKIFEKRASWTTTQRILKNYLTDFLIVNCSRIKVKRSGELPFLECNTAVALYNFKYDGGVLEAPVLCDFTTSYCQKDT